MRPEMLVMSAFGSYAGRVEVPFYKFGDHGIYLITGDTGAGKTTIFDGIVFALYGEASGDARRADMMRSDFAEKTEKTYVELTFSCHGKTYRVVRNPEYLRPKARGEGMTKEAADASLTYPDGTVTSGSRQTTKAVEELLGLDRNQFVQIAMIAQGDFLKLLLAGTDERGRIFRKIFDTGRYQEFQKELKQRLLETKRSYEELQRSVGQYAEAISLPQREELMWEPRAAGEAQQSEEAGAEQLLREEIGRAGESETERLWREIDALRGWLAELRGEKAVYHLPELIQSLEALLAGETRQQEEETRRLDRLNLRLMELQERAGRQKMAEQARVQMQQKQSLLVQLLRQQPLLEEAYRAALDKQPQAEAAAAKSAVLTRQMVRYEELERLEKEIGSLRQQEEELAEKSRRLSTQWEQAKAMLAEGNARLKEIGMPEQELLVLERAEETCRRQREELLQLKKRMNTLETQKKKLAQAEFTFIAAREQSTTLGKQYVELEAAFLSGQAGILAESLEAGKPCPVCGSAEHPSPARRGSRVPSEEELKELSGRKQHALERTTELSGSLARERGRYEESRQSLREICERTGVLEAWKKAQADGASVCRENGRSLQGSGTLELQETADWFERGTGEKGKGSPCAGAENVEGTSIEELAAWYQEMRAAQLTGLEAEQRRRRSALTALAQEKQKLEERLPGLAEQIEKLREDRESNERQRILCHTRRTSAQESREALIGELPYGSRREAELALERLRREKLQIEQEIETARGKLTQCQSRREAEEKVMEALKRQAESGTSEDSKWLMEQRAQMQKWRAALEQRQKQRHARLLTNEKVLGQLIRSRRSLGRADEDYQTLAVLSDTANGELKGRQKLAFEQYIQIVFFSQIIREANKRFSTMTEGRYLLKRREEAGNLRSQTGLELDVFDYYTGRLRSVQSLSGGESFKASLALALGLADVVQQYAGGIQLDTVFIDEGFGSLDRESLNQAIRILQELAGSSRLAGIISHVDELKERIDKKILVKKGTTGSTLEVVGG